MKTFPCMTLAVLGCFGAMVSLLASAEPHQGSQDSIRPAEATTGGVHDFDFFVGHWRVHHKRLKKWLANSDEWSEFEGTTVTQTLMGGFGNLDDNVLEAPTGTYRAVTLRSFDAKSQEWSIWWLDSRSPMGPLGPPVRGHFHDGVGTFYADDTVDGKPIRVRFIWSKITPTSCQWEQAYSRDAGVTWETNWIMNFTRNGGIVMSSV
jgi:hypothetical protein